LGGNDHIAVGRHPESIPPVVSSFFADRLLSPTMWVEVSVAEDSFDSFANAPSTLH